MDQIEEVRRKTDIVGLISGYVTLKKSGRNFKACCPFHEEKTASFMVSPERQIFKCFGCQEGGDVFGFLMKKEGLDFGEALRFLADKAGIELKDYRPTQDQKIKERLVEINHLASEFYNYLLITHPLGKPALQYLLKRGTTKDSIRLFKLGYSPNEWQGLVNYLTKKKSYKVEELELVGLGIKSGQGRIYDRFRGRIMFPLFDQRGRVLGFSGRVLPPKVEEAKYINSPETLLYHKSNLLYGLEITKEAIKKANRAIVVEGELDMISSYQAGVKNVVAIKGSALTLEQIELLKKFCENLSLALDSDSAGDAACRRGIGLAEKAGLSVRVIQVKYGKDPDECAQKEARLWKDSVKEAVPVYEFYINSATNRFGSKTIEGKRQIMAEMAGILNEVTNQVIKAHYVKKLAEILEVSEEAVEAEVDKGERTIRVKEVVKIEQLKPRQERLEEYLLALILQSGNWIEELVKKVNLAGFGDTAVKKIFNHLKQWFKEKKKWEINQFIRQLPEELISQSDSACLFDLGSLIEDSSLLEAEVEQVEKELIKGQLKQRMNWLSDQLKQAEQNQDKDQIKVLQKEFREIAQGLI